MEVLPILRLIWRRRLQFAIGLFGAVALFVALGGTNSTTRSSAVAWTTVALDTPKSQLVAVAPEGAPSLPYRASQLTYLMETDTSLEALARRTGVNAESLTVVNPQFAVPLVQTAMAVGAAKTASAVATPYVLTVFDENNSLPLISFEATAPDRAGAIRLAGAAVAILKSEASPGGDFISKIPTHPNAFKLQPFMVQQVAPMRLKSLTQPTLPIKTIVVPFFFLLAWCGGVTIMSRVHSRVRSRRRPVPA